MPCIACNSNDSELMFENISDLEYETYKPVNYFKCKNCNLIFQNPVPDTKILSSFYPSEYRNFLPEGKSIFSFLKDIQFLMLASKISKHLEKNSKILEIGYGNGQLLSTIQKKGYKNLYGTDFTDENSEVLLKKRIKVATSNIEERFPFNESFDVIIMNNVIEHFSNPKKVLKICKEHLSENGKIILITPNSTAFELKIFKKHWAGFHAPRHTFIFNRQNIKELATNLGFKDVSFEPVSDPGQWSISIQNILQNKKLTKVKLKNGMAWYLMPLSLLFAPVSTVQNFTDRSTGMMCVLYS
ncbi:MAG: hypothetical protein A3B68_09915 [Candidatus Melainabacteria bacterium RIFCSPHIGHO2_02_FULL_34_12]|nr:MAG: hypothetical protein A3B68_09915 [Candidatus Melainabacteria bacterium RIFCSPHIGHO2_02_FULL_34_12]